MRLSITHTTTYRYAQQVGFNPHRLMMRPRGAHDLRVLEHTLRCSPSAEVVWAQDVFGNLIATAQFGQKASELAITSELLVEATADLWPVFQIPPRAQTYPYEHSADELTDLGALRTRPAEGSAVRLWAQGFIRSRPTDTLALLKDLNAGVLAKAAYRPREEEGVQTGTETLALSSGSCRDLAALFIEAARHLGFGVRAVSGYLFDTEAPERQGDTTHAWAEVYLPGAGWIAFDPTHARVGGGGLIAVAIGRCNAQVMPVVGSYVGAPGDLMGMDVKVGIATSRPNRPLGLSVG
jgi:transglutaminase-like putative cysteine protease